MERFMNRKDWKIDIETERKFWLTKLIKVFIIIPDKREKCKRGNIYLRKKIVLLIHSWENAIFTNVIMKYPLKYLLNQENYIIKKQ